MEKRYVLTSTQFNRALIFGAVQLGVIPKTDLTDGAEMATTEQTQNGFILTLPVSGGTTSAPKAGIKKGRKPAAATQTGGIASENIKAALAAVGKNVGLNSINRWDAEMRRVALEWCKNPTEATRPEYVKDRAPNRPSSPPAHVVSGVGGTPSIADALEVSTATV